MVSVEDEDGGEDEDEEIPVSRSSTSGFCKCDEETEEVVLGLWAWAPFKSPIGVGSEFSRLRLEAESFGGGSEQFPLIKSVWTMRRKVGYPGGGSRPPRIYNCTHHEMVMSEPWRHRQTLHQTNRRMSVNLCDEHLK